MRPLGPVVTLGVAAAVVQACSWFRASNPGETTIATPYGTVHHRGPYVPDPAPSTFVTVYCGVDAGVVVDAGAQ